MLLESSSTRYYMYVSTKLGTRQWETNTFIGPNQSFGHSVFNITSRKPQLSFRHAGMMYLSQSSYVVISSGIRHASRMARRKEWLTPCLWHIGRLDHGSRSSFAPPPSRCGWIETTDVMVAHLEANRPSLRTRGDGPLPIKERSRLIPGFRSCFTPKYIAATFLKTDWMTRNASLNGPDAAPVTGANESICSRLFAMTIG